MNYNDTMIKIAKRNNNTRRQYILVNQFQGKHVPIDPKVSLDMMTEFGNKLYSKYHNVGLIIGFAETATAIGAVVASIYKTNYITTTRETDNIENYISFKEEHSHAVDQILITDNLSYYINSTDTIMLIDDELSTGKTMINILQKLKEKYPIIMQKTIVVASILNRMTDENLAKMRNLGIICDWLIKIDNIDYDFVINRYRTIEPIDLISNFAILKYNIINSKNNIKNVRFGINGEAYTNMCKKANSRVINNLNYIGQNVLVLGTEEYMYSALLFGKQLEEMKNISVKVHATTRSPISLSNNIDYPIKNGYKIHSFYDKNRETYIYNTGSYDSIIVITDSNADFGVLNIAINDIVNAFNCDRIILVRQ